MCDASNIIMKQINNQVRVPSSLYTMNVGSLSVVNGTSNNPINEYFQVNWDQSSDRAVPSIETSYVPTRGNSTKSSLTRLRPGSLKPGGTGVDIKHNSYDRYLLKKKSKFLKVKNIVSNCNC